MEINILGLQIYRYRTEQNRTEQSERERTEANPKITISRADKMVQNQDEMG